MANTIYSVVSILILISHCFGCSLPNFCDTNEEQLILEPHSLYTGCDVKIPYNKVQQPTMTFNNVESDKKYVLIMVDPDAGEAADVLHWMVTDIQGSSLKTGDISNGKTQMSYQCPNPPRGETHHYQFLLYEQPAEGIDTSLKRRIKFDLKRFLEINEGWWFSPGTPSEKGQVEIHTALFTEKIEAHEPHSKQGMNAAVDAKGTETMLCGF